ncbi:MAG: hypothetical protein PF693_09115 [Spirochaetia bacterium]|jgi:aspartate ammonia-lyase|nr:hypothetical protein [Spirochaetia bacterium]
MDSNYNKEYLIAVKTEFKLLEKKVLKARNKLEKWETRVDLAQEKGKLNLQTEAEEQVEIIKNDINSLTNQLTDLKTEVEKAVRANNESLQKLSIDPNKLLADMNNLIGDTNPSDLEKEMNIIKMDNELERLKKEMEEK